ncbi:MAG: hypothetical protein HY396_00220 [Candidatus Doudnabacteria bacterium]|nr:hypothetical protein [Candidatus Doudnabacteria bacterium]
MATLVPAILTRDPEEVYEKIKFLESVPGITDIQIDFEDGKFVDNKTILPHDLQTLETKLQIEAHLMVQNPERFFHQLEHLGVKTAVFHFESFSNFSEIETAIGNAKSLDLKVGLAINPATELAVVEKFADQVDLCLLMSVHPGLQGQNFLRASLGRLKTLRNRHRGLIIEIDGGINLDNFETIVGFGADRIVVGSGIWQTPDPKKTIHHFLQKLK